VAIWFVNFPWVEWTDFRCNLGRGRQLPSIQVVLNSGNRVVPNRGNRLVLNRGNSAIGLPEAAAGIKFVVPNLACWHALLKKQNDGIDASTGEGALRAIEDRMEVSRKFLAQRQRRVVGVREEGVFDDDCRPCVRRT
jgi:hypothetical protein